MKKRFLMATAVVTLVIAALCAAVSQPEWKESDKSTYAIAQAEYPEMSPYPDETKYFDQSGAFDSDGCSEVYEAWRKDRLKQRQQEGYQEGLDVFFRESGRQFLSGGDGENRVYSPLNVYMALGMLAELTDQNSRQQILDAIGADDIEALRAQATAVWNANYCDDGAVSSLLASSLWLSEDVSYRQETMDLLAKNYYASSFRGEMGSEAYNGALLSWINEQTGGLLKEQISGVEMDQSTVLALATTIFFQAKWQYEFSESGTEQGIFYGAYGEQTCDFMHQSDDQTYYWGEHFAAVSKHLRESGSMWFILPDEGISVEGLLTDEEAMDFMFAADEVRDEWEKSKFLIVNLSLPKFDVTSRMDLIPGLIAMGIEDVFDGSASDFSPMTDVSEGIFVSKAEHDARVMIDEEGCSAVAYTVMMEAGAAEPPREEVDFVLDRPFLFVITGNDGLPLFAGVVNHAV